MRPSSQAVARSEVVPKANPSINIVASSTRSSAPMLMMSLEMVCDGGLAVLLDVCVVLIISEYSGHTCQVACAGVVASGGGGASGGRVVRLCDVVSER